MNRERAKELLPIIQAFADGKAIEWCEINSCVGGWKPVTADVSWQNTNEYRIKPEPKLRAWDRDECPQVFVVKCRGKESMVRIAIKQVGYDHVRFRFDSGETSAPFTFVELRNNWNRIAEDGTEHPCGVMEANP